MVFVFTIFGDLRLYISDDQLTIVTRCHYDNVSPSSEK